MMPIIQSYKTTQKCFTSYCFNMLAAIDHGVDKAVIMNTLNYQTTKDVSREELYLLFPFYRKEYFENLLQEMLNDGLIEEIKPIPEF